MKKTIFVVAALLPLLGCSARELRPVAVFENSPRLEAVLEKRLSGDRTGACFAGAVIERDEVERAYVCADEKDAGRIGPQTAFEIGSVSKTMAAALLAELILEGKASLDDPLSAYLEDVEVPAFEGQPILLSHLVTHTAGLPPLPPGAPMVDPADPYASLDAESLLRSLAWTTLAHPPGTNFAYSNYGAMLLSYAIGVRAGLPFDTLIRKRLFEPLGMGNAHLGAPPEGVVAAQGHLSTGHPTPAWNFDPRLAGVGGVRATLDDMVAYVRGQLGRVEAPIVRALQKTHAPVREEAPKIGMNWLYTRTSTGEILVHEGGTGGFSAFVGFDPEAGRGVVILSDTALAHLGGLSDVGLHLLDPSIPLGTPRRAVEPPAELVESLVGRYRFSVGAEMQLFVKEGVLHAQATGQPPFALGYDDRGEFYPLFFDARLLPRPSEDGGYSLIWFQGGGALPAERVE